MIALALAAALLAPTPVGVGEREWRIALYRSHVPTGVVHLNVRNYGEDGHDLSIRTRSGKVLRSVPEIEPGGTDTLRVRLRKPGRYVVFCSLAGHEARGMHAVLRVRARGGQARGSAARAAFAVQ